MIGFRTSQHLFEWRWRGIGRYSLFVSLTGHHEQMDVAAIRWRILWWRWEVGGSSGRSFTAAEAASAVRIMQEMWHDGYDRGYRLCLDDNDRPGEPSLVGAFYRTKVE